MKRAEIIQTLIAVVIAILLIGSGAIHLPTTADAPLVHPPVLVYSDPMLAPIIVRAERRILHTRNPFDRAPTGKLLHISVTQYCLQGTTRRDNYVRPGIVAADPRVFPLARYVEIFLGKKYLGRFLVDDTGKNVKGQTIDIWNSSCDEARRFGRQYGSAMLVAK